MLRVNRYFILGGLGLLSGALLAYLAGCSGNTSTGTARAGYGSSYGSSWDIGENRYTASRPGSPTTTAATQEKKRVADRAVRDVAVRDELAYCITQGSLLVLDVSQPEEPKAVAQLALPGEAARVLLGEERAYVACGPGGLQIVDLRTPHRPQILAALVPPAGPVLGLAVEENLAYLVVDNTGLVLVDVTDPKKPQRVSVFDEVKTAWDVTVVDKKAYLWGSELAIVDVSDPAQPTLVEVKTSANPIRDLVQRDDLTLVLTTAGLNVMDFAEARKPKQWAQFVTQPGAGTVPTAAAEEAAAGAETVVGAGERRRKPAVAEAVQGKKAVEETAARAEPEATPEPPSEAAAMLTEALSAPRPAAPPENKGITLYRDYAYLARGTGGLWILNLRDKEKPRKVGEVSALGDVRRFVIEGRYGYVADATGRLLILKINSPTKLERVGEYVVREK